MHVIHRIHFASWIYPWVLPHFLTIFAESGILIGFFLPGDSFLITLGVIASQGKLNIGLLLLLCTVGAILGDSVGYATGRKFGRSIFNKPDSRFFKQENLEKAQAFYEQHGKKTIILARFVPFVRTFAPIVAGAANMHYPTFLLYNIIGGITWVFSMTLFGYFIGHAIPHVDRYLLPIILVIVILSILPGLQHLKSSKK